MEERKSTDIAIIGSGPGGYVAAIRAAQRGSAVTLIEKDLIGGVCLNRGCIPTKALLKSAQRYRHIQEAEEYGIRVDGYALDIASVHARKNEIVSKLRAGVESLLKANAVVVIKGHARVLGRGVVEVADPSGSRQLNCRSIIVATGSEPASIPGLAPDGARIIDSNSALELEEIPRSVAIIGGGYIGVEFASILAAFGAKASLIEMMPQILPGQDKEISKRLQVCLKQRGIEIHVGTRFEELRTASDDKLEVIASTEKGTTSAVAEKVLVAVGRRLNSDEVFADGLSVRKDGSAICVNERLETDIPGLYAIGDVTGKALLAHVASAQGLVAASNATGENETIDYRAVPGCVYCSPEVASVGLTEEDARERGIRVTVGKFPFSASGRAVIMGQTEGFAKLVIDADSGELLGAHIIGPDASHLIAEVALAIGAECTVHEIARAIHAHPTLSEAWMEAAEDALGFPVHQVPRKRPH